MIRTFLKKIGVIRKNWEGGQRGICLIGNKMSFLKNCFFSCFSCASEEYEKLYIRSTNTFTFGQPMQFDKTCDNRPDLENFSPVIRCDSACITVLEPQFFGGIFKI